MLYILHVNQCSSVLILRTNSDWYKSNTSLKLLKLAVSVISESELVEVVLAQGPLSNPSKSHDVISQLLNTMCLHSKEVSFDEIRHLSVKKKELFFRFI